MYLTDYFRVIENSLKHLKPLLITNVQLTEYTNYTGIICGSILFPDGSILHFREYLNLKLPIPKKTYSYHYQKDNECIFRYDNAPHHPEVVTFPHHKHLRDALLPSPSPDLSEVILEIMQQIM